MHKIQTPKHKPETKKNWESNSANKNKTQPPKSHTPTVLQLNYWTISQYQIKSYWLGYSNERNAQYAKFPAKTESSRNENYKMHRVDPSSSINKQQSIHQITTYQAQIEQLSSWTWNFKTLVLSHFLMFFHDLNFMVISMAYSI